MREAGLSVRCDRERALDHGQPPRLPGRPNLLKRNFVADRVDQVWLADIGHIPTYEVWLYLAAIKGVATREVMGSSAA